MNTSQLRPGEVKSRGIRVSDGRAVNLPFKGVVVGRRAAQATPADTHFMPFLLPSVIESSGTVLGFTLAVLKPLITE